ncbi:hypothetical protein BDK51DRAFT_25837 [Blyttiomyces helicus]|uniref:Adenosine kinase n=1 Tax=Blyttiomyces helicus TaxID=388810 RepID=A0A4P9WK92_9FUNG|nr:hypothetical protein BDK51DRAFT_25837 [Blyttiomyces helicus]|eukprot:RKO92812.1 hypothetical protein BDK51DRAFT_25837 [Blyttiomyces helicus]
MSYQGHLVVPGEKTAVAVVVNAILIAMNSTPNRRACSDANRGQLSYTARLFKSRILVYLQAAVLFRLLTYPGSAARHLSAHKAGYWVGGERGCQSAAHSSHLKVVRGLYTFLNASTQDFAVIHKPNNDMEVLRDANHVHTPFLVVTSNSPDALFVAQTAAPCKWPALPMPRANTFPEKQDRKKENVSEGREMLNKRINPLFHILAALRADCLPECKLKADDAILEGNKHEDIYWDLYTADQAIKYVAGGATYNTCVGSQWLLPTRSSVYLGDGLKAKDVEDTEVTHLCAATTCKFDYVKSPAIWVQVEHATHHYVKGFFLNKPPNALSS